MDSGSQRTYITDTLKNKLGIVSEKSEVLNLNTFGNDQIEKRKCDQVQLQLKGQTRNIEISALTVPKICAPLSTTLDITQYPHLEGLELADDNLLSDGASSEIDILIGSDHYYDIVTGEIERGAEGPCAVNSEFCWLVCGSAKNRNYWGNETVTNFVAEQQDVLLYDAFVTDEQKDLTELLGKFWNTEAIGIKEETDMAEKQFLKNVRYDEVQQRYQVGLPWKDGCMPETNGYTQCVKRLNNVYSRLKAEPELLSEYDHVIQQQLQTGIIEQVFNSTDLGVTHYLPHHGVIQREKLTTKLRVVFDGSAKHGDATLSINECLEKGPNLVPYLFDILIKFRGFPIGIASDVEKAFHQIEIAPKDRRMLRFLWFDDITKDHPEIIHYQFCRLVFGLTPSPAILSTVIEQHLESQMEEHPEMVSLLKDSFYVDDMIGGSWDDSGAIEIYEKSNKIMGEGGFKLPKWTSNSSVFRSQVALDQQGKEEESTIVENRESECVKTLGSENEPTGVQTEGKKTMLDRVNESNDSD
ncbi:uncharacterized protein LOC114531819, partial [Dendronephthya gigantea]|uniref:uncharacterized protein LOC114531819 n=1 Tax=Dendronephthya gigantea TaxID=151771 RepID=UPI001069D1BB